MSLAAVHPARERGAATVGVAALHAALLWGLVLASGAQPVAPREPTLKLLDLSDSVPLPPNQPEPRKEQARRAEGAAAPPNLEAKPTPVVAPKPKVRLPAPTPVPAAPLPSPVHGSESSAGASTLAGPGSGSGGTGTGTGSGEAGFGPGGGGGAARPERISGRLANEDYPRRALRAGAEGGVSVRFLVRTDGSVEGCRVTRSSGHAELDSTTCRLIERRFRYRPARDGSGRPVEQSVTSSFDWTIPVRRAGL